MAPRHAHRHHPDASAGTRSLGVETRGLGERLARAAGWLLTVAADNAGAAVHGAVMIGVLFAAEDARHEGYPATIEAAAVVLALYWLMNLYTHTLGVHLRSGSR